MGVGVNPVSSLVYVETAAGILLVTALTIYPGSDGDPDEIDLSQLGISSGAGGFLTVAFETAPTQYAYEIIVAQGHDI